MINNFVLFWHFKNRSSYSTVAKFSEKRCLENIEGFLIGGIRGVPPIFSSIFFLIFSKINLFFLFCLKGEANKVRGAKPRIKNGLFAIIFFAL